MGDLHALSNPLLPPEGWEATMMGWRRPVEGGYLYVYRRLEAVHNPYETLAEHCAAVELEWCGCRVRSASAPRLT